uniref:RskA family anti-sigma factor n=1 Tax=Nocardia carnea TaxID=37328 RepID=UPI003D78B17D
MPDTSPPDSPSSDGDLVDLAIPYALDAVSAAERVDIEHRLRAADHVTGRTFDDLVRGAREAMGALSVLDAQPPPARVEARILAALDSRPGARSDVHTGLRTDHAEGEPPSAPGTRAEATGTRAGHDLAGARRRRRVARLLTAAGGARGGGGRGRRGVGGEHRGGPPPPRAAPPQPPHPPPPPPPPPP